MDDDSPQHCIVMSAETVQSALSSYLEGVGIVIDQVISVTHYVDTNSVEVCFYGWVPQ
jgi:hypothetical protein